MKSELDSPCRYRNGSTWAIFGDFRARAGKIADQEAFLLTGLSASVITRLTAQWQEEQRAVNTRQQMDCDDVYRWVDGSAGRSGSSRTKFARWS